MDDLMIEWQEPYQFGTGEWIRAGYTVLDKETGEDVCTGEVKISLLTQAETERVTLEQVVRVWNKHYAEVYLKSHYLIRQSLQDVIYYEN